MKWTWIVVMFGTMALIAFGIDKWRQQQNQTINANYNVRGGALYVPRYYNG